MSENNTQLIEQLNSNLKEALSIVRESNKHARKRNRLAKLEYQQSVLNYEQAERQYLLEKSSLQPSFRLSVTEFLTCEPDFVNDPEQASEAKYLSDLGIGVDERVLRIRIRVVGEADYLRPSIVMETQAEGEKDQRAYSMTELIYFFPVDSIGMADRSGSMVYLVYRDKTTLPVIHKFRLTQQQDSALSRWDAVHLDTAYAMSHKSQSAFNYSAGCAVLFADRDDA